MNTIKKDIYEAIKAERDSDRPREYLGASSIGRECAKEIWYGFRHGQTTDQFNGRTYRLFEHGHAEEDRIIRDLRRAGYRVLDKDKDSNQFGFEAHNGLFRGHIDGVIFIDDKPCLLECKTASEKSFARMESKGIKAEKPEYYAQAQIYMHYVKGRTPLRTAVFFVLNKNNDDIYIEEIEYNEVDAKQYSDRALMIINTPYDPDASPSWKCSMCAFKNMCRSHDKEKEKGVKAVPVIRKSCRQCIHAELTDGDWKCKKHGMKLDFEAQLKACDDHTFLPPFIGFATPTSVDEDGNSILYLRDDGEQFTQGPGGISSDAMMFYDEGFILQDNAEDLIKRMFGAEVVSREEPPF